MDHKASTLPQRFSPFSQFVFRLMCISLSLNLVVQWGSGPAVAFASENDPNTPDPGVLYLPLASNGGQPAGEITREVIPVDEDLPASDEFTVTSEPPYYVATNGSDSSGNGSSSRPWKTLSHAVKKVPDGATILVRPGTYNGMVNLDRVFSRGITIRSDKQYRARLRNGNNKVINGTGAGYIISGFDIAHNRGATGMYVIQIHDAKKDGKGGRHFTLRDNIIHDSYNNDLIKVNSGSKDIVIEGNMFYNMGGPEVDNHIDVNSATDVIIQDNIFFNDFAASGRSNKNNTGHFIVIKDSNGNRDGVLGSRYIKVRRNIFLNWQGEPGSAFIGLGDGRKFSFYQAQDILIENNLFLGNSKNKIHGPIKIIGAKNVTFRNNTIQGDLPGNSFAMRLVKSSSGLKNVNIRFYNNIWSDPKGTMGADSPSGPLRFSNTPRNETQSFSINSNLYWNNGKAIPKKSSDLINYTNDAARVIANPKLPSKLDGLNTPCWNPDRNRFDGGYKTIREVFTSLVNRFGKISSSSPAIGKANRNNAPSEDILKKPRNQGAPDIGAYEYRP